MVVCEKYCVDCEKYCECVDFDEWELEFYFIEYFYVDYVYYWYDFECVECEYLLWYVGEDGLVFYVDCDCGDVDDVGCCLV